MNIILLLYNPWEISTILDQIRIKMCTAKVKEGKSGQLGTFHDCMFWLWTVLTFKLLGVVDISQNSEILCKILLDHVILLK